MRYDFLGRKHYAEVSENSPLLLPLESMSLSPLTTHPELIDSASRSYCGGRERYYKVIYGLQMLIRMF